MAGYSGTPLVKKLGIKDGHRVLAINAPKNLKNTLGKLPDGVNLQCSARGTAPVSWITKSAPWMRYGPGCDLCIASRIEARKNKWVIRVMGHSFPGSEPVVLMQADRDSDSDFSVR